MFPWEFYSHVFDRITDNVEDNQERLWEAVNAAASYVADYIRSMGGDSADDAVPMGTFVQGYARCDFIDADAIQHTDVRTAYRLSSVAQNANLLFSNQYVTYQLYRDIDTYPIATSAPSLSYSTSQGGYYYTATSPTSGWLFSGTFGQLQGDTHTTDIRVNFQNRTATTFSYALTASPSSVVLDSAHCQISNTWSDSDIYLPKLTGNKSYTDARQILTDYYNVNIVLIDPDAELILPVDLPDFEDATLPTESESETETTAPGDGITPADVVDPSEMYEVLETETYDIPEVDTVFTDDTLEFDTDAFKQLYTDVELETNIVGYITDNINVGFDLLTYMGLGPLFVTCAAMIAIYKVITNHRNPNQRKSDD